MTAHLSATAPDERTWATFEAIALPHVDRLFRLAMWSVRSRPDAEDIVQETMTEALKSFHRFQPGTNCRAWLVTILQHVISNRRRAEQRLPIVCDWDGRLMEAIPFVALCRNTLRMTRSSMRSATSQNRINTSSCCPMWKN